MTPSSPLKTQQISYGADKISFCWASYTTSFELWSVLKGIYSSQFMARTRPLKMQLQTAKKGSLSISDFVTKTRMSNEPTMPFDLRFRTLILPCHWLQVMPSHSQKWWESFHEFGIPRGSWAIIDLKACKAAHSLLKGIAGSRKSCSLQQCDEKEKHEWKINRVARACTLKVGRHLACILHPSIWSSPSFASIYSAFESVSSKFVGRLIKLRILVVDLKF